MLVKSEFLTRLDSSGLRKMHFDGWWERRIKLWICNSLERPMDWNLFDSRVSMVTVSWCRRRQKVPMQIGKTKFRSKKLDFKRALPIQNEENLPDLDDDSINRAVPMVASGVEKEEEEVSHLLSI